MQLPFFTLTNYTPIMDAPHGANPGAEKVSFRDLLDLWQRSFLSRFDDVDTRQLSAYIASHPLPENSNIGSKPCTLGEALVASKLLMPTIHAAEYFFWNTGHRSHRGIDLMMPHQTPIQSFTTGTVQRIKMRDGSSNNEGHCVVIQTPDDHYICYEHLDTIAVTLHQSVNQSTLIGTCGNTGNTTQYHLHLQVDTHLAPFHPYRHAQAVHMDSYTVDPLSYLRNWDPNTPFTDLPLGAQEQEAILWLEKQGIVKGFNKKCFPENLLQRYEMALLMDRVLTKENIYASLPIKQPTFQPYDDIADNDPELDQSLRRLQKYGIMKGHDGHFYPHQNLKGEELLAMLGRVFFNLEDGTQADRRKPYLDKFVEELLILSSRGYIRKAIPRKEVFVLLWKLLER